MGLRSKMPSTAACRVVSCSWLLQQLTQLQLSQYRPDAKHSQYLRADRAEVPAVLLVWAGINFLSLVDLPRKIAGDCAVPRVASATSMSAPCTGLREVKRAHSLRHREFLQLQCFFSTPLVGRDARRLRTHRQRSGLCFEETWPFGEIVCAPKHGRRKARTMSYLVGKIDIDVCHVCCRQPYHRRQPTQSIKQRASTHLEGGDIMGRIGWFGACDVSGRCAGPGSSAGRAGEYGPDSGGRTTGGRGGRVGELTGICGSNLRPSPASFTA